MTKLLVEAADWALLPLRGAQVFPTDGSNTTAGCVWGVPPLMSSIADSKG